MGEIEGPFPGSWAVRSGRVSAWELRKDYERVHPDVYVRKGLRLDARGRAEAVGHWAKGSGILVGFSAAAMHGALWLDDKPAEIALPTRARPPRQVLVYRDAIPGDEVCTIGGLRCTTPARTAFDLARRLDFNEAVEVVDALCNAARLGTREIHQVSNRHPRARGVTNLRRVLPHVDRGAESLQETRTRLLLCQAGFPAPETQIRVTGPDGMVLARLDMGWRKWQVAVEYDGAQHWTDRHQRAWDIDRAAALESLGWSVVRVSAALLTNRPHIITTRTRHALRRHGADF
ncbi:DUF559 domain-containing protein [Nocardia sp. NBC_00508]|uniref:type IV toxin-antitoxin system AbiEi family antitoxin n=1 Tax=Nocardia sp. NBC_00508 TaxID=2975992 RepID=UPI002E8024C0|nr:DUF559 domain-containing protein [Nocardia sp. NBC_00508]WUD68984.1 DUF559 domain-containing protein [Nocardia sp. NBC_00508]